MRAAGMGITPPGGHPTEYGPPEDDDDFDGDRSSAADLDEAQAAEFAFPFCSTPEETVRIVAQQIAQGSDYIKIMIAGRVRCSRMCLADADEGGDPCLELKRGRIVAGAARGGLGSAAGNAHPIEVDGDLPERRLR